jgi:hypothetical protein
MGSVTCMQRFSAAIQNLWDQQGFHGKTEIAIGQVLSSSGIFAVRASRQPRNFPAKIKKVDNLWFASTGIS